MIGLVSAILAAFLWAFASLLFKNSGKVGTSDQTKFSQGNHCSVFFGYNCPNK